MRAAAFFKTLIVAGTVLVGAISFSSQALAWGWATHAYITVHAARKGAGKAIYGSVAADMFDRTFDNPCLSVTLRDKMHKDFMPMWSNAALRRGKPLKVAALGFVSHNDTWGADSTAHHSGLTYGQDKGYVTAKAEQLRAMLQQVPEFQALDIPDPVALDIAHELVEDGVDILVTRPRQELGLMDSRIRLMNSAWNRNKEFPALLADTYSSELASCAGISDAEARTAIISAEARFRLDVIAYGVILCEHKAKTIELMSERQAARAGGYLASKGITLPPGTDLTPLARFGITTAMDLCQADFKDEIDATITSVRSGLAANGVSY